MYSSLDLVKVTTLAPFCQKQYDLLCRSLLVRASGVCKWQRDRRMDEVMYVQVILHVMMWLDPSTGIYHNYIETAVYSLQLQVVYNHQRNNKTVS